MFDTIIDFLGNSGIAKIFSEFLDGGWQYLVMYAIVGVLFYLAIVKKFEPLLLLPIAFGMLLTNLVPIDELKLIHLEYFFDDFYLTVTEDSLGGTLALKFQEFIMMVFMVGCLLKRLKMNHLLVIHH